MVENNNNEELSKEKKVFLMIYKNTYGNVSKSCAEVKINRDIFNNWKEKDKLFDIKFKDAHAALVDDVEELMHEQALKYKSPKALEFLLKTKYNTRGYSEKSQMEVTGKDGVPINITLNEVKPKEDGESDT